MPISVVTLKRIPTGEIIETAGEGEELTTEEIQELIVQENACIELSTRRVTEYNTLIAEQQSRKNLYEESEGESVAIDAIILQYTKEKENEEEQILIKNTRVAIYQNYL